MLRIIMRVLLMGDVVARPGRTAVLERIQDLRELHAIDFVVMNAENVSGGFSITPPHAEKLFAAGVDVMTSGNHIFDKREAATYITKQPRLLRPANYPRGTPGRGLWTGRVNDVGVAVICVMGRLFMPPVDDPFRVVGELLATPEAQAATVRLVDIHAEATSEKAGMAHFLDGRVSAVTGTHTHVPTADERILPNGTAFQSDLGMTGSYSGVIGMNAAQAVTRFTTVPASRAEHSQGQVLICCTIIDIDDATGRAQNITRLALPHEA